MQWMAQIIISFNKKKNKKHQQIMAPQQINKFMGIQWLLNTSKILLPAENTLQVIIYDKLQLLKGIRSQAVT